MLKLKCFHQDLDFMFEKELWISLQQTGPLLSAIALGKESFAFGKAFAKCCTRQRGVDISLHGKGFFAEYHMSGTPQRLCRVPRRH
jgi:hypothetical protein